MSIPLDRLYHFLESFSDNSIVIYYFFPHGTKNCNNLRFLNEYPDKIYTLAHKMICHDQEPLDFDRFKNNSLIIINSQHPTRQDFDEFDSVAATAGAIAFMTAAIHS